MADTSLPGLPVARELDAVIAVCKAPTMFVSDNGAELTNMANLRWSQERRVEWHYIAASKPTHDAFIESLNGKFRAECLNVPWFTSLDEVQRICEEWRRDYNEVRLHSAIGNKPAISLMNCSGQHGPA